MDLQRASYAELGRFIAQRTDSSDGLSIAHATVPEIRYNAVVGQLVADVRLGRCFTKLELRSLAARITDGVKRRWAQNILDLSGAPR
ncbi:MAG: hypothetical protein GX601_05625 [Anaerolineales bacterium]|nr:hypothetical protein [Anaerolineales bacterium]